jgi:glycosyltransferase involved in cell wall biosynthesis
MDITFLAINYLPSVGGAQTLVRRVAEGLVARHGHRVRVITTDALHAPGGSDPGRVPVGREMIGGVEVVRLPVARRTQDLARAARRLGARLGRPIVPSASSYGPWGAQLARAALSAGRRSDVLVGVSAPFTTVPAAWAATRRGRAAFVAAPILHLGEWSPTASLVRLLVAADRCIALTPAEREWLLARGAQESCVEVVPPGCDEVEGAVDRIEARRRLGMGDGPVVAVVGRLAAQKGIDAMLAACPALLAEHPELTVLLAGTRTAWSGLDESLAAMAPEVAARVLVIDGFTDQQRPDIFGAADVVVVPSREEAFGMVVVEAWAVGRPVVASDIAAIRSVVRDGVDALLVAVGDPEGLARAVSGLLHDEDRAASMGAAGHDRVASEFSWDAVVDRWNEILVAATTGRAA